MGRRRAPHVIGFAFAAAAGLYALKSTAQTPDSTASATSATSATTTTGSDLLQPSLEGNPRKPPRFRLSEEAPSSADESPPPGKFTAPTRIGATPVYGSPTGFGAGDTGFDSSNTPHSKKKKKQAAQAQAGGAAPQVETTFTPVPTFNPAPPPPPPAATMPPPAEIYPKKAAARVGATLPPPPDEVPLSNPPAEVHPLSAANRAGALTPIPPPENFDYSLITPVTSPLTSPAPPTLPQPNTFLPGTLPQRPLPIAATDPYAALGIRAGSFLLLPSLDLSGGYNTNPERTPGGPPSPYLVATPELKVQSDWERHSLSADIAGSWTQYGQDLIPSLNVPYLNSKIDGRIDVTRDTQLNLEQRVLINTDNPGSPNLQAELAKLPINTDVGDTIGIAQQFNRLSVSFNGLFDRATYDSSQLTNGQIASNADRNFDQYAGLLRIGVELSPALTPFVQVQEDRRIHDEQFDRSGLQRDSVGTTVQVGSAVDMFGALTGEMAVGYVERTYADPTLPDVTGPIANGTLIWQITGLTTAKLTAASQVYETVLAGASGELSRDVNVEVDHAFRSWLIGALKVGYGTDDYVGIPLSDNRYFISIGLTYIFTRELQVRAEIRQDWQYATESDFTYTATTFLLGLHLQP